MSNKSKVQYSSLSQFHANNVLRDEAVLTDAIQSRYMQGNGTGDLLKSILTMEFPQVHAVDTSSRVNGLLEFCSRPIAGEPVLDRGPFGGLPHLEFNTMMQARDEDSFLVNRSGLIRHTNIAARVLAGIRPELCEYNGWGWEVATRACAATFADPVLKLTDTRTLNAALSLGLMYSYAQNTNCLELLGTPQSLAYSDFAFGMFHPALTLLVEHCDGIPDSVLLSLASMTHRKGGGSVFGVDETMESGNMYCREVFTKAWNTVHNTARDAYPSEVPNSLLNKWDTELVIGVEMQAELLNAVIAHYTKQIHPNGVSRPVRELLRLYIQNACAVDAAARRTAGLVAARVGSWRQWHHGCQWLDRSHNLGTCIQALTTVLAGINILSKGVPVALHVQRKDEGVPEVDYVLFSLQAIPSKDDQKLFSIRARLSSSSVNAYWTGMDSREMASMYRNSTIADQLVSIPAHPKYDKLWWWVYEKGPHSCMVAYPYRDSPVRAYCCEGSELYLHVKLRSANLMTPDSLLTLMEEDEDGMELLEQHVTGRAIGRITSYVRAYGQLMDSFLRSNGFEHDERCLEGQPLRYIEHSRDGECILMPYLDGDSYNVDIDGQEIVINAYGDYGAQDSAGFIYHGEVCTCGKCHERAPESEMHSTYQDGEVCEDCLEDYVMAIDVNDWVHTDDIVYSEMHDGYIVGNEDETEYTEGLGYWSTHLVNGASCDYTNEFVPEQYTEEDDDGNTRMTYSFAVKMGVDEKWLERRDELCPEDEEDAA